MRRCIVACALSLGIALAAAAGPPSLARTLSFDDSIRAAGVIGLYHDAAGECIVAGDYQRAIIFAAKAVTVADTTFGPTSEQMIRPLARLAYAYCRAKLYHNAAVTCGTLLPLLRYYYKDTYPEAISVWEAAQANMRRLAQGGP